LCKEGQFPVSEASTSNLRVSCVVDTADGGNAVKITDFDNTAWHDGASRWVTASITSGSTTANVGGAVATTFLNIAGTFSTGTFGTQTGDENRVVEAGFNKGLQPGTFIVAESGTGPGGTITLSQAANKTASNLKLLVENGPGRSVKDASWSNGGTSVTSPTANFVDGSGITSDVGRSISGTGIQAGTVISAVNSATNVTISQAATAAGAAATIGIAGTARNSTHRLVMDLSISTNKVWSPTADFDTTDIGLPVKGTGVPANSYIASVQSATNATISLSATTPAANIVAQIGNASATAPLKDGFDPAATIQTELQLDPGLVAGSPDCSEDVLTGTNLTGVWNSPAKLKTKPIAGDAIFFFNDSFLGISDARARPTPSLVGDGAIIGQIDFRTSVVNFGGYVQKTPGGSAVISMPFVPTGLGQCAGTDIASTWAFNGTALSHNKAPTGYGKAGSGSFRVTPALDAAGTPSVGTATYENRNAHGVTITGLTMNAATDVITKTAHGLTDGQVVTVSCAPNCAADGLKDTIAYYVKVLSANTFSLTLKPFSGTHGAVSVPAGANVNILATKVDATLNVLYNTFDVTFNQPTDSSCTIARPNPPLSTFNAAFNCQAG
jgi:hypothetical protein